MCTVQEEFLPRAGERGDRLPWTETPLNGEPPLDSDCHLLLFMSVYLNCLKRGVMETFPFSTYIVSNKDLNVAVTDLPMCPGVCKVI